MLDSPWLDGPAPSNTFFFLTEYSLLLLDKENPSIMETVGAWNMDCCLVNDS